MGTEWIIWAVYVLTHTPLVNCAPVTEARELIKRLAYIEMLSNKIRHSLEITSVLSISTL